MTSSLIGSIPLIFYAERRKEIHKVLIIEDESNIRELISYNLTSNNHEVIEAEDGLQSLEMAVREKPDLILLDLMLPGRNGLDMCKDLRDKGSRIPIIILTAKNEDIDKVMGLEFDLLKTLAENKGMVMTRDQLLDKVWGINW